MRANHCQPCGFALSLPALSSEKVCGWLNISPTWERKSVPAGYRLPETEILFRRIDKKVIEEESEKLSRIIQQK